jgi:hypothetical protein
VLRDRGESACFGHVLCAAADAPGRTPGIAVGGTAITTGTSLPHVLPRAGMISGYDSPHSPTQRNTLIRDHIVRAGLLGLLDTANLSGPRKSPRPSSPTPRCDKSVTTRPAAVITDRPAPRGESPVQRIVSACERDARPPVDRRACHNSPRTPRGHPGIGLWTKHAGQGRFCARQSCGDSGPSLTPNQVLPRWRPR